MLQQFVRYFFTVMLMLLVSNAFAQMPSQQQIEQFKRLPKSQQEKIAQQMGFDLKQLQQLSGSGFDSEQVFTQSGDYPRGTKFDEFGNPVSDELEMEKAEEESDELKLYGSELFANGPSTFTPIANIPVPANYVIGPGDQISVHLYGKENEEYELEVGRDGKIVIPKLGPFSVASKTFDDVRRYLTAKIKEQVIGVEVSVSMGELRTIRVFVMGEAYKPGAYNVSSLSTITNALFVSGGVSDIASLRNIQLKRAGKLVTTLDLYELLNNGDSRNDTQLQAGDVVFIPAVERTVSVDGQVRRPAIYELKDEQTIEQAVKLAGGKLAEGFAGAVSVKRYINGVQMQLTADLENETTPVKNGDYITVPRVSPFISNAVTLIGAVARPGKYQFKQGLTLTDIIGNPHKDLLEDADLTYVLVLRQKNANQDLEVLQADLTQLTQPDNTQDILLAPNDQVLVFSRIESEVLGQIHLEKLAYTIDELEEQEKEAWDKRIEEKLFWRSIGLDETQDDVDEDEATMATQTHPIIELTEAEKNRVLEFRDTTYYSRKRMLAPVIARLKEQAKFGQPLQVVEIAGEVKVPGLYPLSRNASILKVIKAAGGLTESSYPLKSEVTRTYISEEGVAQIRHLSFSPQKVLAGESDVELKSKDRINIFSIPSWQEELKVTIKGEVEFPGTYTIRRGETITDLLERAGGITGYGDVSAAVFTRESLKEQEKENLRKLAEELRKQIASESLRRQSGAGAMVSYDEAKKLLRDLTQAQAIGRLVVDFDALLEGDRSIDVALQDGDTLFIPRQSQTVNVIGEVYVPTSHLFTEGLDYEDYILRSGGYRSLADSDSTYIIRANGSVDVPHRSGSFWYANNQDTQEIMPGDTIVVPFDADNVDGMTLWANATQIIYQLAVAVAAIGSL